MTASGDAQAWDGRSFPAELERNAVQRSRKARRGLAMRKDESEMRSSHVRLRALSRSCRVERQFWCSMEEKEARTVLASVMVSAKLGMPFDASSNKAFGLKMTEVFRKRLTRASARRQRRYHERRRYPTNP
mgnify:FL=1